MKFQQNMLKGNLEFMIPMTISGYFANIMQVVWLCGYCFTPHHLMFLFAFRRPLNISLSRFVINVCIYG